MNDVTYFTPRPIGLGWGPCFACGAESDDAVPEVSLFVGSKADGALIAAMFPQGARLDYRDREPNWIQVKITACKTHERELEILIEDAKVYRFSDVQVAEHYEAFQKYRNQETPDGRRTAVPKQTR